MTKLEIEHAKVVLRYIMLHEEKDFNENPSEEHVYYSAWLAFYGERSAQLLLNNAIERVFYRD